MRFKSTGFLAVLFAVVLAWVYVYEIRGGRERQAVEEAGKRIYPCSPEEVSGLWLRTRDGSIRMERAEEGWEIREPIATRGDDSSINLILTSLEGASIERVVTDSAADLAMFGLDDAAVALCPETADGALDTLEIGGHNPTLEFVYTRLSGSPRVFLVPATVFNNANKDLFVLRDKQILRFERDDVRRLTLERSDARYVFERENGSWRIAEPISARADRGKVDRVINALKNVKTKEYVSEGGKDLTKWGLDPPRSYLELLLGEDGGMKRLELGDITGAGDAYGHDVSREPVFLVPAQIIGYINEEIESYRDRTILPFDRDAVTLISVVRPEGSFRCEKDSSGAWTLYEGDDPRRIDADGEAVERLVSDMYGLRAESFVGKKTDATGAYGLEAPTVTIRLDGLPGGPASMVVGRRETETATEGSPHEFAYLATDRDDWIYTARWTLVEGLLVGADDLRAKAAAEPAGGGG